MKYTPGLPVVLLLSLVAGGISRHTEAINHPRVKRQTGCPPEFARLRADHTMCQADNPEATEVTLTEETKRFIVNRHNVLRATANPQPFGMPRVEWDENIAVVAAKWSRQCSNGHELENSMRDVPSLPGVTTGQNVAVGGDDFDAAITRWHNENLDFEFGVGSRTGNMLDVSHYTQIVSQFVTRIGCGQARCGSNNRNYFVCNYARGQLGSEMMAPYCTTPDCTCLNTRDGLCDCEGKTCVNIGVMDFKTCQCTCPSGHFTGASCEKVDCVPQPPPFCTNVPCNAGGSVPYLCPTKCGFCPSSCFKNCYNGGTQNSIPCLCNCPPGWTGDECLINSNAPVYDDWSQWSRPPCPVTCGRSATKTAVRSRSCISGSCSGNVDTQQRTDPCNLGFSCSEVVDGGVGEWAEWTDECSGTCGTTPGFQRRVRQCDSPLPRNGGRDCTEQLVQTRGSANCNLQPCPVRGLCEGVDPTATLSYRPNPTDCNQYIQCHLQPQGQTTLVVYMFCPYGQHWNDGTNSCEDSTLNVCSLGGCPATKRMEGNGCRAYWECTNFILRPNCCKMGHRYIDNLGCYPDLTCRDPCPGPCGVTEKCQSYPHWSRPDFYYHHHEDDAQTMERVCPPNSHYDVMECGCVSTKAKKCQTQYALQFSNFNAVIAARAAWFSDSNVIYQSGEARFQFNSQMVGNVRVPKPSLEQPLVIRLRYKELSAAQTNTRRLLLTGRDCKRCSQLDIRLVGNSFEVTITAYDKNEATISLSTNGFSVNTWVDVVVLYSGKELLAAIRSSGLHYVKKTETPSLDVMQCGFQLGDTSEPFNSGVLESFSVYSCSPGGRIQSLFDLP